MNPCETCLHGESAQLCVVDGEDVMQCQDCIDARHCSACEEDISKGHCHCARPNLVATFPEDGEDEKTDVSTPWWREAV